MAATVEKPDAWMPLYVGDYLRDTGDLSLEEHGAYTRLLMHMWGRDGRLPLDHVRLARLCLADRETWARVWPAIERFFEVSDDGGWISQRRLMREIEIARQRRTQAVENGRRGAEVRRAKALATLPAPLEATPPATPVATLPADPQQPSSPSPSPSPSPSESPSSPPVSDARARDPGTPAPEARPRLTWTPQRLLDLYGRLRSDTVPDTLPWTPGGGKLWEKARPICLAVEDDPEAAADIEPTMRMQLDRAKDSQDPRDREAAWGFSVWAARFTDLREEMRGLSRGRDVGEPCGFHRQRGNDGKPAPRHLYKADCPECRHVTARASPRAASAPTRVGDIAATNRR